MMKDRLKAFRKSQRSAVAMIFALSFIPLIYLVGLSVDYTFFSLANNQALLAAQGAATNAVRAAVSTYTLETYEGVPASTGTKNAYSDGQTAGAQAGYMWFLAQLGQLPRGSISYTGTPNSGGSAVTANGYPEVTVGEPSGSSSGGGYVAKVSYSLTYPPLFNGLFKRRSNWVVSGNTQATSNFDYAEILFLLDASNSMLIGTGNSDILAMEYNSVCQSSSIFDTTSTTGQAYLSYQQTSTTSTGQSQTYAQYDYGTSSNNGANDGDEVDFRKVTNYYDPSNTKDDTSGTCTSGNSNSSVYNGAPLITCALACHTSSGTTNQPYSPIEAYSGDTNKYPEDLYGEARRLRAAELDGIAPYTGGPTNLINANPYGTNPALSLRLDIVMDSTNLALSDMLTAEAFTGQFTAGVYTFTSDVSAVATGTSATATNPTSTPEATSISAAQTAVNADDYIYAPENTFPPIYNSGVRNTDFVTSMGNLLNGKNSSGTAVTGGSTAISPITNTASNPVGQTASNPLKFLFIVTDGLQDIKPSGSSYDQFGEMTSYNAENSSTDTNAAVCKPYKTLGFTIYVLAIQYYPVSSANYYVQINDNPTPYTTDDYPTEFPSRTSNPTTSVQDLVTTDLTSSETSPPNTSSPQLSPVDIGLQACASNTNDFYTATGASSINTAINTMLRSALASTIRLSN